MSFTSLSSADLKEDECSDDHTSKGLLVESDSQADLTGRKESARITKNFLPRLTKVAHDGAADNSDYSEDSDEMRRTDDSGDFQVRIKREIVTTAPLYVRDEAAPNSKHWLLGE